MIIHIFYTIGDNIMYVVLSLYKNKRRINLKGRVKFIKT